MVKKDISVRLLGKDPFNVEHSKSPSCETKFVISRDMLQYYLPANSLTPSPSATDITCARLVFPRALTAFRSIGSGIPDRGEGTGGSMIS